MQAVFDFSYFPVLATDRLTLRELTHADAGAIQALFGNPQVLEYLTEGPVETHAQAIALIDWLNEHFEQQHAARWGITLRGTAAVIGTVGFHRWDRANRHAELGYDLLPGYWGHGYATEASRAVIDWSFANLDLHRLEADCTDGNLRSERVLVKCGFKVEGLWRERCWEHGRFVSLKQFGLLRHEYEAL